MRLRLDDDKFQRVNITVPAVVGQRVPRIQSRSIKGAMPSG